eukprot:3670953-Alexandrium_andersonii.AAC.1
MGRLNKSTVQDLCAANECVALFKKQPDPGLILPHISPGRLRRATFRDASWGQRLRRQESG